MADVNGRHALPEVAKTQAGSFQVRSSGQQVFGLKLRGQSAVQFCIAGQHLVGRTGGGTLGPRGGVRRAMTADRGAVRQPRPAAVPVLGVGHYAPRIESCEKSDNEKKRETFHVIALLHLTWWNLYR